MAFDLTSLLKDVPDLGTGREQIEYIKLDLIDEDPNNFYQLSAIDELAANIELCGLQQPIRVRKQENGRYMIVSGHRRRAAVAMLAQENPEKWGEVACIVSSGEASPNLRQLQLIFANANTRKMTDAEIAEQAAQVKNILYRMKEEEGFEFPGRMRDHVAEIVKISKSKLSRLEAIGNNLSDVWQPLWKDGTLSESSAYEISKLEKWLQNLLFEEKSKSKENLKYFYAQDVTKFGERAQSIQKHRCRSFGGECINCEAKLRKAATNERYGWFSCDGKCCKDCSELLRCKKACPRLADQIREGKATAKQSQREADERQAERDRSAAEFAKTVWQRVGQARAENHVSIEKFFSAQKVFYSTSDDAKVKDLEFGNAKFGPDTKLPFGYHCEAASIMKIVAVADALGCSIDWLLGRTDRMEVVTGEAALVPYQGTIWHPITEEPPLGKKLVWIDCDGTCDFGQYLGDELLDEYCVVEWKYARWWAEPPKEDA